MMRNVYERNDYSWLEELSANVKSNILSRDIALTAEMKSVLFPFDLPKNIAPAPKISKSDLESRARSRFTAQSTLI